MTSNTISSYIQCDRLHNPWKIGAARSKQQALQQMATILNSSQVSTRRKRRESAVGCMRSTIFCFSFLLTYSGAVFKINIVKIIIIMTMLLYKSTPVECLHTILLGPYKYLLADFMTNHLSPRAKREISAWLAAFNFSGFQSGLSTSVCRYIHFCCKYY